MRKSSIIMEIVNIRNDVQDEIDRMPDYPNIGKRECLKRLNILLDKIYARKKK